MFQKKAFDCFFALFAFFAVNSLLVGCGNLFHTTPSKPQLYRVEGRVLDGLTRQGLGKVRILLKATIPTQLNTQALAAAGSPDAQGSGTVLANYAMTAEDGSYTVELSEGFQVVRSAARIRVEASLPGYSPGAIDLPVPSRDEPVHKAPDLLLMEGAPAPPSTLPRGVFLPGIPSQPNPGAPVRATPPSAGPQPKRPQPGPIPWK